MGKLSAFEIMKMQKRRKKRMLVYLCDNVTNNDINEAMAIMYSTKTYECLMDLDTDFYWKPFNEICYLLEKEIAGDMVAWEKQAF